MDIERGLKMVNSQDFYNAIQLDITMIKGDTLAFNFQIEGATPTEIIFTCKENPEDTDVIFEQSLSGGGINLQSSVDGVLTYSVRVRPDQTAEIDTARYYYDLQMDTDTEVITLMKGRLIVEWGATS